MENVENLDYLEMCFQISSYPDSDSLIKLQGLQTSSKPTMIDLNILHLKFLGWTGALFACLRLVFLFYVQLAISSSQSFKSPKSRETK